jgi:hypothetical protein
MAKGEIVNPESFPDQMAMATSRTRNRLNFPFLICADRSVHCRVSSVAEDKFLTRRQLR